MSVWFTSDLHIRHVSVARMRLETMGYSTETLSDTTIMALHDEILASNWDQRVQPEDMVWVLGDDSSGTNTSQRAAIDWLGQRPGVKHKISGNHDSCLDSKTRVVTKRGFVHAEDLHEGEEVLTVDDQLRSVWAVPHAVVRYPYEGDLVAAANGYIDSVTTPDHRVVGISRGGEEWTENRADSVNWNTLLAVNAGQGHSDDYESVTDKMIRIAAWAHTDSHKRSRRWTFYQSEGKRQRIHDLVGEFCDIRCRVRDITEIAGKQVHSVQPQYEYTVNVSLLNEEISDRVPDKDSLAPWVWLLSERQVDLFVEEWVYADGSPVVPGSRARAIYCSREGLRHQLMALMACNGWRVTETEYRPGHWRLNATKRLTTNLTVDPVRVPYAGNVWCLQMPPYGRFFAERSGRVFLTGNCHPMQRDSHQWFPRYSEVYASIQSAGRRRLSNDKGHVDALLSHFPYRGGGDHTEKERYTQWRLPDLGKDYIIHGHTHSDRRIKGRQIHVGVDSWDYRPVHLDEIVDLAFG